MAFHPSHFIKTKNSNLILTGNMQVSEMKKNKEINQNTLKETDAQLAAWIEKRSSSGCKIGPLHHPESYSDCASYEVLTRDTSSRRLLFPARNVRDNFITDSGLNVGSVHFSDWSNEPITRRKSGHPAIQPSRPLMALPAGTPSTAAEMINSGLCNDDFVEHYEATSTSGALSTLPADELKSSINIDEKRPIMDETKKCIKVLKSQLVDMDLVGSQRDEGGWERRKAPDKPPGSGPSNATGSFRPSGANGRQVNPIGLLDQGGPAFRPVSFGREVRFRRDGMLSTNSSTYIKLVSPRPFPGRTCD